MKINTIIILFIFSNVLHAQYYKPQTIKELCGQFKYQLKCYTDYGETDTTYGGITKDSLRKVVNFDYTEAIKKNPDSLNLYVIFYLQMSKHSCHYWDSYVQNPEDVFWEAEKHCKEKQIIYPILVRRVYNIISGSDMRISCIEGTEQLNYKCNYPEFELYKKMCSYLEQHYPDSISPQALEYYYLMINANATMAIFIK